MKNKNKPRKIIKGRISNTNTEKTSLLGSVKDPFKREVLRMLETLPRPLNLVSGTKIIPSALTVNIRKVDYKDVVRLYLSGKYESLLTQKNIPPNTDFMKNDPLPIEKHLRDDFRSMVYYTINKGGIRKLILNNGYRRYREIMFEERRLDSNRPRCFYCMISLEGKNSLGMPVDKVIEDGKTVYITLYDFCSWNCLKGYSNREGRRDFRHKDVLYNSSPTLIREMFFLQYPKEVLRPSPDPGLAEWNGGELTEQDYFTKRFVYIPGTNVVTRPGIRRFEIRTK